MKRSFFDYDDGDMTFPISDNMVIDSEGDLLMRLSYNMAMDINSGDIHMISFWSNKQ